jgi:predicted sulfurtransferase
MKTTFEKTEFSAEFDHKTPIVEMMNEMGYTNVNVETCLTNGLSHYVKLNVEVLNEGKCYADMFVFDGRTSITIRISDHKSGLERNCGGVCGNKMTMFAFKRLISEGAIKQSN